MRNVFVLSLMLVGCSGEAFAGSGLIGTVTEIAPDGGTGGATGEGDAGTGGAMETGTGGVTATGGAKHSTGGVTSTGGSIATGGTSTGGVTGVTGGVTGTGGTTSTGGATATGGTKASGGVTATGGVTSTGGTTSTGGATSTGGTTACPPVTHNNGLGQTWQDCVALGTYNEAQAMKACKAAGGTDCGFPGTCDVMICYATGSASGCWGFGAHGLYAGLVKSTVDVCSFSTSSGTWQ